MLVRADVNLVTLTSGVIAEFRSKINNYYLVLKLAQFMLQHSLLANKKIL